MLFSSTLILLLAKYTYLHQLCLFVCFVNTDIYLAVHSQFVNYLQVWSSAQTGLTFQKAVLSFLPSGLGCGSQLDYPYH